MSSSSHDKVGTLDLKHAKLEAEWMLQMAGKHWQSRISTLRVLSRSGCDDGVGMLGRPHLACRSGTWNSLASHPGSEGRVRLKPVEQGQGRDGGTLDDQAGQGKRHGRLGWMVVGAKDGHRIALFSCS